MSSRRAPLFPPAPFDADAARTARWRTVLDLEQRIASLSTTIERLTGKVANVGTTVRQPLLVKLRRLRAERARMLALEQMGYQLAPEAHAAAMAQLQAASDELASLPPAHDEVDPLLLDDDDDE